MRTVRVHYDGRVQGVGFRWTVKNLAKEFDVTGTVCNLADGRVELLVQGEIDEFLEAVRTSALAGHITGEVAETVDSAPKMRQFQIIP